MSSAPVLRVAFVGAGRVNFGGGDGPWDHASRLEVMPGVAVVGIVDPALSVAEAALAKRRAGTGAAVYAQCRLYGTVDQLLQDQRPDAVFLGTPALYRGNPEAGKDLELKFVKAGVHVFCEKPLSLLPPEEFAAYVDAVTAAQADTGAIVSVGYMFRYHAAVRRMRELMQAHGGAVMALNARYHFSYSDQVSPVWWDQDISGGPIVEQATHFCDLARFLAGDVTPASVSALCLRESDAGGAGVLHGEHAGEASVPVARRVPRVTAAAWRFTAGGGIGSLMHTVALRGARYETQLEVLLDGLRLTLVEPYQPECRLLVRDDTAAGGGEQSLPFDDDPYVTEIAAFLHAVRTGDTSGVRSTYADAAKTYNMTWDIRRAGEANSH